MGSGIDGVAHIADRDGNPNVFNLNEDGGELKLNANNAKPDNRWNSDNRFVFRLRKSFLSRALLEGAVFLLWIGEALLPAAEHLARFIELLCDFRVMSIRHELALPRYIQKILQRVEGEHALDYSFYFLLPLGIIREICQLQQIKEFVLDTLSDGVSLSTCHMLGNANPEQISLFETLKNRSVAEVRAGGVERRSMFLMKILYQ